jgi:ABC-type branched-subunit amino acid transport system substrate-binding protein
VRVWLPTRLTLKLKTVAVMDDRTAYGQGVADVFKKVALAKGMKVVDEQFTHRQGHRLHGHPDGHQGQEA